MLLAKQITWRGHRWNEIIKNDNPHMVKVGYDVVLRRPPAMSELKKTGQCVGGIDAKLKELVAIYPRLSNIKSCL